MFEAEGITQFYIVVRIKHLKTPCSTQQSVEPRILEGWFSHST